MRRRGGASGQPVKGRRALGPKARKAPTALASSADLQEELDRRTRELDEALERQIATSEVLGVISSSPTDVQPVFDLIAKSAARLCRAQFCHVFQFDGKLIHFAASYGYSPEVAKILGRGYPMPPGRGSAAARSILNGAIEEIPDIIADHNYAHGDIAKGMNYRSIVAVPMLKDGCPIGAIAIAQSQPGRFPERQIDLLRTFAAQAVIAIENVRLFEAEQQRTCDLAESLQQQTATSEVLRVISSSQADLAPVFEAMLANATRICAAKFGILWLREGDGYRLGALYGAPPSFAEARWREPVVHPGPKTGLGRIALTKQAVHIADVAADQAYAERDPLRVALVEQAGAHTFVMVPMLKENELIGTIAIYRQEVRPFTDKQIGLVKNFADQAVIAIENTRLLKELRRRTDDLSESLEQQTATSEVLRSHQQVADGCATGVGCCGRERCPPVRGTECIDLPSRRRCCSALRTFWTARQATNR